MPKIIHVLALKNWEQLIFFMTQKNKTYGEILEWVIYRISRKYLVFQNLFSHFLVKLT